MFYLMFPSGWYVLLAFSLVLFAVFTYLRKSTKGAVKFGLIGLIVAVVTEAIGVGLNLWNYTSGNWPVILWITYFIYSAAFYQIVCVMQKK